MRKLFLLLLCSTLCGCVNWRENADKPLIWAHQAARLQSQVAEPYFRLKCGKVVTNCKTAGVTCKTDVECKKKCPVLVTCQGERHAVNKAIIGVHVAVLGGRQLLVVGKEDALLTAVAKVVGVVQTMRELSLKFGLFGNTSKPAKPATQPASQPGS